MQPLSISIEEIEVHTQALKELNEARVEYVVAGAVALGFYTGLWRHTKDLDLFLVRSDVTAALTTLAAGGFRVKVSAPHWLAHAYMGEHYVDLIHGFGGWRAPIDQEWFRRGIPSTLYGQPIRVAPVEDMIWIKAYVCHRERFDGADIVHMIRACHATMDWDHLLRRFGSGWQLLLFYLNLYRFVYPSNQTDIPAWLTDELARRLRAEQGPEAEAEKNLCNGPLIDRYSYVIDLQQGMTDGRIPFAIAQGWRARDVEKDRLEAEQMVKAGMVRPDRAA